ncbi:hypothetical protein SeMB42_g02817 [Synchytrium endobioticum]|uniref:Uncharacterized protein n=1 Tax=Synchytrium endobioticum TaxID=286115 RepID=A0A507DBL1_9FUNG|nr:hypothetical protein SeMB42_g02817 [Synchytrium endobioticum]
MSDDHSDQPYKFPQRIGISHSYISGCSLLASPGNKMVGGCPGVLAAELTNQHSSRQRSRLKRYCRC